MTAGRTLADGPRATVIEEIVAVTTGLDCGRLPASVLAKARLCVLDTVSACLTIGTTPGSEAALAVLVPPRPGEGGSRVFGRPDRADMEAAAFVNAVSAAASIRTDTHPASASHPGMVVIPAVLAAGEAGRVSGAAALAGIVAGYEVMIRLGLAVITPELAAIFRPTGLLGPGPAAAAAARALGLSRSEAVRSMALACHTAGGFNEWVHAGTNEHVYHAGFAARSALAAVRLARAGAQAAPSVLEGRSGLLAGFSALARADLVTEGLGRRFLIEDIVHKPTPACVFAQAPIQAAARLLAEGPLDPEAVRQVEIATTQRAVLFPGCDNPGPFADLTAVQQSIQFAVAAVLAAGGVREASWSRTDDPRVAQLATRCRLLATEGPDQDGRQPVHLRVWLRDGTRREARVADFRSMSEDDLASRFLAAARPVLGESRAEAALRGILRLDAAPDINDVTGLLAPPPSLHPSQDRP
ncbi:hypothetical protein OPKNFCMD_4927 [Methylobacterium crusticola]|uniref:MmgE/PrpD family protein n=1 Tax=Methylobacterium crusticola TaxID=1697972 RepID=A0ABQ4R5D8_9HYPH|nr:MmgE/PrpD family protein [Methylobacterium crusticola]GJD52165.1 hypothetical protein OPKNFCMD_4927 [Methylobacterium crusticola]